MLVYTRKENTLVHQLVFWLVYFKTYLFFEYYLIFDVFKHLMYSQHTTTHHKINNAQWEIAHKLVCSHCWLSVVMEESTSTSSVSTDTTTTPPAGAPEGAVQEKEYEIFKKTCTTYKANCTIAHTQVWSSSPLTIPHLIIHIILSITL